MSANPVPAVVAFYQGRGRALVDERLYPAAIANHLDEERRLVRWHLDHGRYSAVVEVGCMDGSVHLETLLDSGAKYLGIDLVPEAIDRLGARLRRRFPGQAFPKVRTLDVCRLGDVREELDGERTLVVFPFNAFGNLPEPGAALRAVGQCDCDALILTYRTDPASTALRRLYYARCGYADLTEVTDERGVLFRSREGLHSYAHHDAWLRSLLRRHAFDCTATGFGELGLGFWARLA